MGDAPPYRLLLGDCLERMGEIEAGSVDAIICDLPYGVTLCDWDSVIPLDALWQEYRRILAPHGVVVLTATQPFAARLIMSNPTWFRYEWIWEKSKAIGHRLANKRPMKAHEGVYIFAPSATTTYNPQKEQGYKPYISPYNQCKDANRTVNPAFDTGTVRHDNLDGSRYPRTVLRFKDAYYTDGGQQHPTQKPVALMEYLIRTYTDEGETVLDSCMGSGTTGVGCINTNRRFIGIEQDPDYFAIAQERIRQAACEGGLFAKEFTK